LSRFQYDYATYSMIVLIGMLVGASEYRPDEAGDAPHSHPGRDSPVFAPLSAAILAARGDERCAAIAKSEGLTDMRVEPEAKAEPSSVNTEALRDAAENKGQ
jgi:hypothetical protein